MAECTCIKDMEEKLKTLVLEADFASERPKNGVLTVLYCKGLAFIFRPKAATALNIPFIAEFEVEGKTGKRRKEVTVNVIASFCPFCGKSQKQESEDQP